MYDSILKDVDSGNVVVLLLLDMSAAFDTVDHSILLGMLGNNYGITGDVHKWFASYLTNRTYCVNVRNAFFRIYLCFVWGAPRIYPWTHLIYYVHQASRAYCTQPWFEY